MVNNNVYATLLKNEYEKTEFYNKLGKIKKHINKHYSVIEGLESKPNKSHKDLLDLKLEKIKAHSIQKDIEGFVNRYLDTDKIKGLKDSYFIPVDGNNKKLSILKTFIQKIEHIHTNSVLELGAIKKQYLNSTVSGKRKTQKNPLIAIDEIFCLNFDEKVLTRQKYKQLIQNCKSKKVFIVDDCITTGFTTRKLEELLTHHGIKSDGVVSLGFNKQSYMNLKQAQGLINSDFYRDIHPKKEFNLFYKHFEGKTMGYHKRFLESFRIKPNPLLNPYLTDKNQKTKAMIRAYNQRFGSHSNYFKAFTDKEELLKEKFIKPQLKWYLSDNIEIKMKDILNENLKNEAQFTIALIGSRAATREDKNLCYKEFLNFYNENKERLNKQGFKLISGGADGIDQVAEYISQKHNIPLEIIKPDYSNHPAKQAPILRNLEIIEKSNIVLGFWDQKSKGTKQALDHAISLKKKGKSLLIKTYRINGNNKQRSLNL